MAIAILSLNLWPHINLLMMFTRVSSMFGGIPWALAKNCVWPPTIAYIMMHFPLSVQFGS